MDDTKALAGHLKDLAQRSYQKGIFTFSNFLGEAQKQVLAGLERELSYTCIETFGGREFADRVVARFGSEEVFGYAQDYPILCLKVSPASHKFSDVLTHRDFLGSLMGLGIERELLGDIIVRDDEAYLFCIDHIAPFIIENLVQVKHTSVCVTQVEELPENARQQFREMVIIATSPRIDAIVSKVYNLSRSQGQHLAGDGKIFVNGITCENTSYQPKEGDIISVRGFGKFLFAGQSGTTDKGRCRLSVRLFI